MKVGVDLIEIERIERALERPGFRERCFTEAERAYCDSRREPGAELRGAVRRQGGGRQGARLRRRAFTWKEIEIVGRPKPGVQLSGRTAAFAERVRRGRDRPLDDALARARGRDRRRRAALRMAEMFRAALHAPRRCARPRSAYPDTRQIPELMERAGRGGRREAMLAFPAARSFACVCGGGSNGGDGRVAARVLREAGARRRTRPTRSGRLRRRRRRALRHGLPAVSRARRPPRVDRADQRRTARRSSRSTSLRRRRVDRRGRGSRRRGRPRR